MTAWKVRVDEDLSADSCLRQSAIGNRRHCHEQAAAKLWPDIFSSETAQQKKDQVLKDMTTVRPVVETG